MLLILTWQQDKTLSYIINFMLFCWWKILNRQNDVHGKMLCSSETKAKVS